MARTIDLNVTTYWWIAGDAGIANPDAVSAAVLTAPLNISQYLHSSTSVNPTSSDTVSERGITDTANVITPIIGNYEGTLVGFRDLTAGAPSATDILTLIGKTAGIVGWVVRRKGFASNAAAAATQKVDVFKFATDNPQVTGGQGDGMLKATIPLLAQGVFRIETALVA
jgi:hypothetical protein